jgi:hypothetical protein
MMVNNQRKIKEIKKETKVKVKIIKKINLIMQRGVKV